MKLTAIIDTYANIEKIGGTLRYVDKRNMNLTFMGAFANWLASTRLYLESERDFFLPEHGEDSAELRQYKEATAFAFDSHQGYRFLYNLRDYAQHCGVPISGMTMSADDGKQVIEFYLSRAELLTARFSWSRHARQLIESWSQKISIMPLVDDAMTGYRYVEDKILGMLLQRCGGAVTTLREGIALAGSSGGHPAIFIVPSDLNGGQMAFQSFPELASLDRIEQVLDMDDPLAHVRRAPAERPPQAPGLRDADARAAAVIATWLEHSSGPQVTDLINHIAAEDQGFDMLIGGLVNLSAYQLKMLEGVSGIPPQAFLSSFTASDSE